MACVGYDFQAARLEQALADTLDFSLMRTFDLRADDYHENLMAFAPDIVLQYGSETTDEPMATLNERYRVAPRLAPTWFAENAWLPQKDYLYLDAQGVADQSSVARITAAQLPPTDRRRLDDTLAAYRHRALPAGAVPRRGGFLLLCLQMPRDTVIVRASPFQDMQALIDVVESAFPELAIVVRPHPGDPSAYRTRRADLRRDGTVAEWIVQARLVLACNSTTLLEAMALGVPAAALGRGVFSNKGVCWEWDGDLAHLHTCLDFRPDRERLDAFLWELARRQIPLSADMPDHRPFNPVLRDLRQRYS
ncbi:capsular polysaccharide biosynthesis protein [Paludibacterium purpuratum]|uniref:Capsular polysaccharide biosynthesis protein n=1 Tax=Paludibacterium purpuratum TaxID=1144873 RepID=A0A4R7AZP4_9NEIS|nr:capsular polysaccharide biosynthesis protein [Paludibacterium purpuratum]